ncbi:hypothetical protein ACFSM5_21100 [Lacibacterium aquatile]|uniref:GAF domain-containing protein n=1 Tax=Lacibacterium aquatile TaxID=1168082 RepID=A0ABW5DWQ1_9PROT
MIDTSELQSFSADKHLVERLAHALPTLGINGFGDALSIYALPLYGADPGNFTTPILDTSIERIGWRLLVLAGDEPIACVDQADDDDGGPGYMIRGTEVATALKAAIEAALSHAEAAAVNYSIRFLSIPVAYTSAVWLCGPDNQFFPTRAGVAKRPEPARLSQETFTTLIAAQTRPALPVRENGSDALS